MNVVIAAGGTGGHFYPGLAVARKLKKRGDRVRFLIRRNDYVTPLLEREGFSFHAISASGWSRGFGLSALSAASHLAGGFVQSVNFFRRNRADVLLAMGGYLSVPPGLAAAVLGVPVVLHEQNVLPGLANRILARFAKRIAVSFPASVAVFGPRAVLTGNPVRDELAEPVDSAEARRAFGLERTMPTLLVFGGSLGARRLNQLAAAAAVLLSGRSVPFQILHFTGRDPVEPFQREYAEWKIPCHVQAYCHDMPRAYAAADVILCRAGATTVAELMAVRKPAVLVPYPYASAAHQLHNAGVLGDLGAAKILEERGLNETRLAGVLEPLLSNLQARDAARAAYRRAPGDPLAAAGRVVDALVEAAG